MNKSLALVFTPLVLIGLLVGAAILTFLVVNVFAINPLLFFGLVGLAAAIAVFIGILFALLALVFFVSMVYFALRDVGEPYQRSSGSKYSLDQQEETGKKEQKI